MIRVRLNGELRDVPAGLTVAELLEHLGVRGTVAVEVNREVVPRDALRTRRVADGDVLEIVTFVGGG